MASDLGASAGEVHGQAREVLRFWLEELKPEDWFAKSDALDAEIARRFEPLRGAVLASGADEWRDSPETLLAAIVLLDQFSRNVLRGTPAMYAADPLALELAGLALERGWDRAMTLDQRKFVYLSFEHAESAEMQATSLRCFGDLGDPDTLDYARAHADVIARFGRFPSRNAILGRQSTPGELAYLSQPCAGW